jgi:hypothetical protein
LRGDFLIMMGRLVQMEHSACSLCHGPRPQLAGVAPRRASRYAQGPCSRLKHITIHVLSLIYIMLYKDQETVLDLCRARILDNRVSVLHRVMSFSLISPLVGSEVTIVILHVLYSEILG